MVTITWLWSGASSRLLTVPKTMSLNLSCDWPGCSPSALSKVTVTVGPSFDRVSQASQAPIATATSGITQMTDRRRDRRVVARAKTGGSERLLIAGSP